MRAAQLKWLREELGLTKYFGAYRRWRWYRESRPERRAQFWYKRDPEENERGRLPDDEQIDLGVVWVAEVYTPSTAPGLLSGVEELGWDKGPTGSDDLLKWMSDVRRGKQAGWRSLGFISTSRGPQPFVRRSCLLPDGIVGAMPVFMSVTPSMTAAVIGFVVSDDRARLPGEALRAEYATHFERGPGFHWWRVLAHIIWNRENPFSYGIIRPDDSRQRAFERAVEAIEDDCVAWVRKWLPGIFAEMLEAEGNPTANLFISDQAVPLTDEFRSIEAFRRIDLGRAWDAWHGKRWIGGDSAP
jgi:hypothetical protein